jgi:hypothetical protein
MPSFPVTKKTNKQMMIGGRGTNDERGIEMELWRSYSNMVNYSESSIQEKLE